MTARSLALSKAAAGGGTPPSLRLLPSDPVAAVRAGAVSIVGVTLFILLLDSALFRGRLDAGYVAFYSSALLPRTVLAMRGSLVEELVFRLVAMSLLTFGLGRLTTLRPVGVAVIAIALSQLLNIGLLLPQAPLYVALRFWLVGAVWGVLYWRHGWVTAAAAHPLCHLLLDPALRLTLLLTVA